MAEYITKKYAELVLRQFKKGFKRVDEKCAIDGCILEIQDMDSVDVVSRAVLDQIKWERDIAILQLESYGISLGEKADVAKVVHGRWDIDKSFMPFLSTCSQCGVIYDVDGAFDWNYCPNCGAIMDGKDNVLRKEN